MNQTQPKLYVRMLGDVSQSSNPNLYVNSTGNFFLEDNHTDCLRVVYFAETENFLLKIL